MKNKSNWVSEDLRKDDSWVYFLDDRDHYELECVIASSFHMTDSEFNRSQFEMPYLSWKLQRVKDQLLNGRGIALIKNFPVNRYTEKDTIRGYAALAKVIGNLRPLNGMGWLVSHIRDFNVDQTKSHILHSQTNLLQDAHTDSCDIVSLLCLNVAAEGGMSYIASSEAILDQMDPADVTILEKPLPYDRRTDIPPGEDPWFMMPITCIHEGKRIVNFNRLYVEFAVKLHANCPPVSQQQWNVIDRFSQWAKDKKFGYRMMFEPGDIQLVNNLVCVHGRTSYIDIEEQTRHLLRLWLSPEEAIPIPNYYKTRWGSTEPGARGGIKTKDVEYSLPVFTEAYTILKSLERM
jgi:Taurine catabolism dioxygenase TauD, TfdA family